MVPSQEADGRSTHPPAAGELFDVVNHAVQVPLRVDLFLPAQVEPARAVVVPDVAKYRLHGSDPLAVKRASSAGVNGLSHPITRIIGINLSVMEEGLGWCNTLIGDALSELTHLDERIKQYDQHVEQLAKQDKQAASAKVFDHQRCCPVDNFQICEFKNHGPQY